MIITQQYPYSESKLIEAIENLSKTLQKNPEYEHYKQDIEKNINWSKNLLNIDDSTKVFLKHIHTYKALSFGFDIVSCIALNEPIKHTYRHPHSELYLLHLIDECNSNKTNSTDLQSIIKWVKENDQPNNYNEQMIQRFEGGHIEALCYSYDKIQKQLQQEFKNSIGR